MPGAGEELKAGLGWEFIPWVCEGSKDSTPHLRRNTGTEGKARQKQLGHIQNNLPGVVLLVTCIILPFPVSNLLFSPSGKNRRVP